MNRWLVRTLVLALVAVFAVGSGWSVASADEGDRSVVPRDKLTDKPFRGVTLVTVADRVVCTGFIIGERKVVTAAHCLVRNAGEGDFRFKKNLTSKLSVFRAYSGIHKTPPRSCPVIKAWAHSKFVKAGSADKIFGRRTHDIAVLTTVPGCTFPQNSILRLWDTEPGDGKLTAGQSIRAAGYPADPRWGRMNGLNLWRTEGKVKPIQSDERHLVFTGFVSSGMSGGPVWKTYNSDSPCGRTHCVVGIITECAVNSKGLCKKGLSERLAVRITPQVKQLIMQK